MCVFVLTHKHMYVHTHASWGGWGVGVRAASEVADIVALLWQHCAGVVRTQASE